MRKWIVAIVVMMACFMLPFLAKDVKAETVASGTCGKDGDNLTWTLDDEGVLTISGEGEMANYYRNWAGSTGYTYTSPFYRIRDSIRVIVIEDGVTSVGQYAFYSCSNLESLTIGTGLLSIGNIAFSECIGLTEINYYAIKAESVVRGAFENAGSEAAGIHVVFGEQVEEIPADLFSDSNTNITSVTIGNHVTSIGDGAFGGCPLTSITIPNSVTSIGNSAFSGCNSLTSVTIPDSVTVLGDYAFNFCEKLTSVIIGNSVMRIGDYTFQECPLTSVTIPDSVTAIGTGAFDYCQKLTNVTIGDGVETIGNYAFYECERISNLTIGKGVKSFGDHVFEGCRSLIQIVFNAIQANDLTQNNTVFTDVGALESGIQVVIGDQVEYIPAFLFYNMSKISGLRLGERLTIIGNSAFSGCSNITSLTLPDSVTSIEDSAFSGCSGLTGLAIPDNVTNIGNSAFSGCSGLTGLTISDNVTSVGERAFSGCSGLTYLIIGKGVTYLGDNAFSACRNLIRIEFDAIHIEALGYDRTYFGNAGAAGSGIEVIIGDQVEIIPDMLFSGMRKMKTVTFGSSVTSIGEYAFSHCAGLTSLTLGNNVVSIDRNAFAYCTGLKNLTFGNRVAVIGEQAFYSCTGLKSLNLENSITSIGASAFEECTNLTDINYNITKELELNNDHNIFKNAGSEGPGIHVIIGNGVEKIPANLFYEVQAVSSLMIPDSVTSIGDSAFSGCSSLTSLTIPDSVTSIGDRAFCNCSGLTILTIGEGVQSIERYAFCDCSSLTEIHFNAIHANDLEWLNAVFSGAGSEGNGVHVIIGDKVEYIPAFLFNYGSNTNAGSGRNPNITRLTIGKSVADIGMAAFCGCSSLTEIVYNAIHANDLTERVFRYSGYYGSGGYAGCDGPGIHITIGNEVEYIPAYMFYYDINPIGLTLEGNVNDFGKRPIGNCPDIITMTIGKDVSLVASTWFDLLTSMETVEVDEDNESLAAYNGMLFNKTLKILIRCPIAHKGPWTLPNTLRTISAYAMTKCAVEELVFPEKVSAIEDNAFHSCSSLKKVTFLGNKPSFGTNCFYDVTCKGHYPFIDSTWAQLPQLGYRNNVTWIPYSSGTAETISLVQEPNKTVYEKGEEIDLTGFKFEVSFTDGLVYTYDHTEIQGVEYDFSEIGKRSVTIFYENLELTFHVIVYEIKEMAIDPSEYPESEHPYANGIDETYRYQYSGAYKLALTFSEETKLENGIDFIYLLDASDQVVGTYTGTQLSGQTIEISGDTAKIRLVTDDDGTDYGFSLTSIIAFYRETGIWTWTRLAGSNRYMTMALAAQEAFADHSCTTLIIASGQAFPDALSGSALAGVFDCPILLTNKLKLSADTKSEILRLAAPDCKVLILGGNGAVSADVEAEINNLGIEGLTTERVKGSNREATAKAVYEKGGFKAGGTIIVATGYSYADVLSISPYSYAAKAPIILAKKDGSLSDETKELIEGTIRPSKVIIIGGGKAVTAEAEDYLKGIAGEENVMRLSGKNRYITSAEIMKWELGMKTDAPFQPEVEMHAEGMGVATGTNFADALGAVSLLGKTSSVMLLVADNNQTNKDQTQVNIEELVKPNVKTMTKGYIFGGKGAVSLQIEEWLNEAVE